MREGKRKIGSDAVVCTAFAHTHTHTERIAHTFVGCINELSCKLAFLRSLHTRDAFARNELDGDANNFFLRKQ